MKGGDYRLNLMELPQLTNGKNLGSPLMTLSITHRLLRGKGILQLVELNKKT